MKGNNIGRTVGVYGEAYIQFELARRGWVVDAIGATAANGIDLLAWKTGGPNMGINVKTRLRNERGSAPRATASFSPISINTSGSSTLKIKTNHKPPTGAFTLTITATGGGLAHSQQATLTIK